MPGLCQASEEGEAKMNWLCVEQAEKEVKRLDPKLGRDDEAFDVAVILIVSILIETQSPDRLALFTMRKRELVYRVVTNLKKNGVFTKDGNWAIDWWDKETGSIAFWLDVNIGMGYIKRVKAKP